MKKPKVQVQRGFTPLKLRDKKIIIIKKSSSQGVGFTVSKLIKEAWSWHYAFTFKAALCKRWTELKPSRTKVEFQDFFSECKANKLLRKGLVLIGSRAKFQTAMWPLPSEGTRTGKSHIYRKRKTLPHTMKSLLSNLPRHKGDQSPPQGSPDNHIPLITAASRQLLCWSEFNINKQNVSFSASL